MEKLDGGLWFFFSFWLRNISVMMIRKILAGSFLSFSFCGFVPVPFGCSLFWPITDGFRVPINVTDDEKKLHKKMKYRSSFSHIFFFCFFSFLNYPLLNYTPRSNYSSSKNRISKAIHLFLHVDGIKNFPCFVEKWLVGCCFVLIPLWQLGKKYLGRYFHLSEIFYVLIWAFCGGPTTWSAKLWNLNDDFFRNIRYFSKMWCVVLLWSWEYCGPVVWWLLTWAWPLGRVWCLKCCLSWFVRFCNYFVALVGNDL